MLIRYEKWNPSYQSRVRIDQANEIIEEYLDQGYTLTLRQLYYQFVARGLVPNVERSYKNLVTLVTKARKAGMISWKAIHDGNRNPVFYRLEEDPENVITGLQYDINFDYWARQDNYIEVWVEKDALSNVIQRPCREYHVPYMACKGYLSSSEAWRAGQRFRHQNQIGKACTLIHLADHDPEGVDMTRDNDDRLAMFSHYTGVEVRRIALNMDQIEEHQPPPNYAKVSSSRYEGYVNAYGEECWELDALEPATLHELLEETIREYIDFDEWSKVNDLEDEQRAILRSLEDHWDDVKKFLESK